MRAIFFGILTAGLTFLQAAPVPQPGPVALTGRVVTVSGSDQRPVRRAKVTVTGGAATMRVTDTDIRGAYRFDRLPAGDYKVTVQKAGFVKLETAASRDSTLTLERAGAIEGTVADVAGDPIWNVRVRAFQTQPDGKPKAVWEVRTDDLGRYRLHSLPAGDYYVEAATDQAYLLRLLLMAGEKRPEVNRTLYPAASFIDDAKPVRVSLGRDTTAVDLMLTPGAPMKDPAATPPPTRRGAPNGTARIAGRVVDAASGKPIRNARVQLLPVDAPRFSILVRADAQGRFSFPSLEPGRYTLNAEAERFVTLEFGQKRAGETGTHIQLRDREDFTADFRLPRARALEGTVFDEFGDPAPMVMVQVARKQYVAGRQRLMPVGGRLPPAVTDDQGRYRISGLLPGEYHVAGLSGAYTEMNEVGGFAPTYYPGTTDAGAAVAITIDLGADSSAPFSLVPAKTVSVSGMMVDAEGKPVAGRGTVWLMTPDHLKRADFNLARGSTAPDGKFVLRNVPKGSYTMQGFGPAPQDRGGIWREAGTGVSLAPMNLGAMSFGWLPLTVGDTDLDTVTLTVTNGTSLRGKVVLEDTSLPPPNAEQVRVTALPMEFDSAPVGGGPPPSETHADLTFEATKLSGMRRIFVSVASPSWNLKKITLNEVDITDTPQDFRTKDVEGVEVVLSSKVSRITGGVSDDKGPVGDYALVFFPSDPTKWIDRSRFVMMARPTQHGRFDVRGLPPEDYLVIALPNIVGTEWQDPDFFSRSDPRPRRSC